MEVLGVAYRWTPARHAQWQRWADRLGARLTLLYTHPDRADQPTYVGNTHFEFTGYAAAARHAQTDGPYVVVNDTLLCGPIGYLFLVTCSMILVRGPDRRT